MVNILLRCTNVKSLLTLLTPKKSKGEYTKKHISRIFHYVDFVLDRKFFLFKKTCLKRSLVLYHFLRLYNCLVNIHIGVRNDQSNIAAHSWLTLNGRIVGDSEEKVQEYVPIFIYPN